MAFDAVPFRQLFSTPQRNGLTRPKRVRGSGFPMVNMGELFAYSRIENVAMDFVPVSEDESQFLLEADDLLFARQSLVLEGAGQCSIFIGNTKPTVFESHIIRCRLDRKKTEPRFYYYYFRSPAGRNAIRAIVEQGAGASGIRGSDLAELEVPLPPLDEQCVIAETLGALDDRIDNLRQTNTTLQAIAAVLFKSWFRDFDRILPADMQQSELGLIPKGWRVSTVGEHFDLTMGQSPPGDTYNEIGDGMPFYQGRADFGWRFPTERVYCTAPTRLAKKCDVLVSVRAPVGDMNVALNDCAIGRGIAAVHSEHTSFALYVLLWLKPAFMQYESEGTVFGSINKKQFEALPIIAPPDEVVCEFQSIVHPMDSQIENNEMQARTLEALRDTLLPRLISGKLRVDQIKASGLEAD